MGFSTALDLLYWQPNEDGVPYAITQHHVKQPDMKWGGGFRLGFEYEFKRDNWAVNLNWTCLPIHHRTESEGSLFPIWSNAPQNPSDFVSSAKALWRLHLGIVDLELKKPWDVSPHLTFFPRLGVRFASIRQKFYVAYSGGTLFPNDTDNFNTKNKFWGVGPEMGVDADWGLSKYFSLIARAAYSIVYGEFYIHETEREMVARTMHLKLFNIYNEARSLIDLVLGLEWKYGHASLRASWEQHFFSGQNQLLNFTPPLNKMVGNGGDLAVSGISLGGSWRF
jgi:hypothetical protein